jgi:hypothetical protein
MPDHDQREQEVETIEDLDIEAHGIKTVDVDHLFWPL